MHICTQQTPFYFAFLLIFPSFISLCCLISLLLPSLQPGMSSIALGIILTTHLASLPSHLPYCRPTISLFCPFFALFGIPSFSPLPLLSLKPSGKSIPSDLFPLADWTIFTPFFRFYTSEFRFFCAISSSSSAAYSL